MALPGAIGFIQTAGELLNFHPHLHLLITDGVLRPDGSFERLPYPDSRQLERLFRAELRRLLYWLQPGPTPRPVAAVFSIPLRARATFDCLSNLAVSPDGSRLAHRDDGPEGSMLFRGAG